MINTCTLLFFFLNLKLITCFKPRIFSSILRAIAAVHLCARSMTDGSCRGLCPGGTGVQVCMSHGGIGVQVCMSHGSITHRT